MSKKKKKTKAKENFIDLDDLKAPKRTFKLKGKKYEIESDLPLKRIMQLAEYADEENIEAGKESEALKTIYSILEEICPEAKDEFDKMSIKQTRALIQFLVRTSGEEQDNKKK